MDLHVYNINAAIEILFNISIVFYIQKDKHNIWKVEQIFKIQQKMHIFALIKNRECLILLICVCVWFAYRVLKVLHTLRIKSNQWPRCSWVYPPEAGRSGCSEWARWIGRQLLWSIMIWTTREGKENGEVCNMDIRQSANICVRSNQLISRACNDTNRWTFPPPLLLH